MRRHLPLVIGWACMVGTIVYFAMRQDAAAAAAQPVFDPRINALLAWMPLLPAAFLIGLAGLIFERKLLRYAVCGLAVFVYLAACIAPLLPH